MPRALTGLALAAMLLGGCGGSSLTSVSPSQSGVLANASVAGASQQSKPFNPFSQDSDSTSRKREVIENPTIAQVMQAGALPERALGRLDAPVTVIKYASMTCPYCRQFHRKTFPQLKKRYIDTGKLRFILPSRLGHVEVVDGVTREQARAALTP